MELKVFKKAIDLGYDDNYMVFFNFMNKLLKTEGKRTHFYFYAKDVKKILNIQKDNHATKIQTELKPFFDVAILNTWTVRITWNGDKRNEIGHGIVHTKLYDIKDTRALNMFFYLLGRMQDPTIVDDKPILYEEGTKAHYNIQSYTYALFEDETFTGK